MNAMLTWNSALRSDECVETREYGPPSMKKLGKLGEATPRYAVTPSSNIWHLIQKLWTCTVTITIK